MSYQRVFTIDFKLNEVGNRNMAEYMVEKKEVEVLLYKTEDQVIIRLRLGY